MYSTSTYSQIVRSSMCKEEKKNMKWSRPIRAVRYKQIISKKEGRNEVFLHLLQPPLGFLIHTQPTGCHFPSCAHNLESVGPKWKRKKNTQLCLIKAVIILKFFITLFFAGVNQNLRDQGDCSWVSIAVLLKIEAMFF